MARVRLISGWVRSRRDRLAVQAGAAAIAVGVGGWVHVWAGLITAGVALVAYGLLLVDGEGPRR